MQIWNRAARGVASASIAAALWIAAAAIAPAMSDGGGGGGGSGGGNGGGTAPAGDVKANTAPVCAKGQVYNAKRSKCVKAERGVLPDAAMAEYAYALAKDQRYEEALRVLDLLDEPNTPRALNYRGYATRKLGRTDEGISYYLKSVALDPNYAQVREYLGEAYVVKGRIDLARDQLATIKTLCGTGCVEYEDLAQALEDAKL
jgi:tetratricopeptide (TPR) repeat protein